MENPTPCILLVAHAVNSQRKICLPKASFGRQQRVLNYLIFPPSGRRQVYLITKYIGDI